MISDLHNQQINVKNFDLGGGPKLPEPGAKSMVQPKKIGGGIGSGIGSGIGGGIGSGIGGGLKRPTQVKPQTGVANTSSQYSQQNGINGHGITGTKIDNRISMVASKN